MDKDTDKVEEASVIALRQYLLRCPRIKPIINDNDKTPFWDGDLYVYKNDDQKGNVKDNFHGRVSIQVKGRSDNTTYFKISNAEAKAYYNDGGCLFFKVLVNEDLSSTILYFLLSRTVLKKHLQQSDGDIKFQLEEVPNNPLDFQQNVYDFVTSRNKEKNENATPKEIADLVEGIERIRGLLNEIEDKKARIKLKSYLDTIKNLTYDNSTEIETIGWRDTFIICSQEAIDLAANHLRGHDFSGLQFDFGTYLHEQKLYHLVERYYLKALAEYHKRAEALPIPLFKKDIAFTLNNLGELHRALTNYELAEKEFKEALDIFRELAKGYPDIFIADVAMILNNLGLVYGNLNRHVIAEQEYLEALKIFRELAKKNPDAYIPNVALTLNNLSGLHFALKHYEGAEREAQEALEIYRELAKKNPDNYIGKVAMALNNLGNLHLTLSRYEVAEEEYTEALKIYRELAKKNPDAYIPNVALSLNNLSGLHFALKHYEGAEREYLEALKIYRELADTNCDAYNGYVASLLNNLAALYENHKRYEEAEQEYKEALTIYRELVKKNRDAYLDCLAETLYNLASLRKDEKRIDEGRVAANEVLDIYKELAKKYPQIWSKDVAKTQRLLDELQTPNPSASTKV